MNYFLVIVGIALVLSPLFWMKPSLRQKQITALRGLAPKLGLRVRLHRRPDALDEEKRLECVNYYLPWSAPPTRPWVLHRFSTRGWESPWAGWHWRGDIPPESRFAAIGELLQTLPEDCSALVIDRQGVGAIWQERSDETGLTAIASVLHKLQREVLPD